MRPDHAVCKQTQAACLIGRPLKLLCQMVQRRNYWRANAAGAARLLPQWNRRHLRTRHAIRSARVSVASRRRTRWPFGPRHVILVRLASRPTDARICAALATFYTRQWFSQRCRRDRQSAQPFVNFCRRDFRNRLAVECRRELSQPARQILQITHRCPIGRGTFEGQSRRWRERT